MTARGALSIVGTVAGSYFGGPVGGAIGGMIGGAIGGEIDGPQSAQGPRLTDLKLMAAQYGQPIPYVDGHPRIAGTIIWATDKRKIETTTSQGGKGSDTSTDITTYTYEIDLLVLWSAVPIAGVTRIWKNNKLVYSTYTDAAVVASLAAESWTELIVYTGGPTQLPDPTYEAAVGVGNAPAYRGRGTCLIRGLQLGQGGQLPNLTAEVATSIDSTGGYTEQLLYLLHMDSGDPPPGQTIIDEAGNTWSGSNTHQLTEQQARFGPTSLAHDDLTDPMAIGIVGDAVLPDVTSFCIDGWLFLTTFCDSSGQLANVISADHQVVLAYSGRPTTFTLSADDGVGFDQATTAALDIENQWTHVRGTYDGNDLRIFVNGVLQATETAGFNLPADTYGVTMNMAETDPNRSYFDDCRFILNDPVSVANFTPPVARFEPGDTSVLPTATPLDEDLAAVVSRLCLRAGLTAGQIDVTALSGIAVKGFAIGQVTSTRQVLDILAGAYLFEAVESAGKIKFVLRGGASVVTIPYADMGATTGDPSEPLPLTRRNDEEAPTQVVVRYSNALDDAQDGSEFSDRLVGHGTGVRVVDVPLLLSPTEARRLADVAIMDIAAASMNVGPVALTRDYAALEPTDIATLIDHDGAAWRMRVLKLTESGGVRTIEGQLDDASVVTSVAATSSDGYTSSTAPAAPADTVLQLLDIPIARDADDDPGFYAAAKGNIAPWPGATILGSVDDLSYTERATVTESAVAGTCDTTLGNYSGANVFDWSSSLQVDVGAGTLASDTRDNLLTSGANAALIGDDEVIQFLNATLLAAGVYLLTGLLRGRLGTEWAQTGHAAGERFVLLRLAGLRRIANATNEIGALRYYKGVTLGRALGTAAAQNFTNTARGLKPWAGVDLRGDRDASANLTITWSRRTRLQANFTNGTVPLGEASESYEVDVYEDGTYAVVKRTLAGLSSATASYTAAQQTTDFGSAQATVYLRVYQLSATLGRGYALQGAL